MKTLAFLGIVFSIFVAGCQKDVSSSNQKIELKYGATNGNTIKGLNFALDSVLDDSRCPENACCIWEGNAKVRFIYSSKNNIKQSFMLNTYSGFRTDTVIDGYRIKLIQVNPYPRLEIKINQADYKAVLEIKQE